MYLKLLTYSASTYQYSSENSGRDTISNLKLSSFIGPRKIVLQGWGEHSVHMIKKKKKTKLYLYSASQTLSASKWINLLKEINVIYICKKSVWYLSARIHMYYVSEIKQCTIHLQEIYVLSIWNKTMYYLSERKQCNIYLKENNVIYMKSITFGFWLFIFVCNQSFHVKSLCCLPFYSRSRVNSTASISDPLH